MKKTTTILQLAILMLSFMISSTVFAQQIFTDDFESGMASTDWGAFWTGEEVVTAVPMATAPDPLPNGGNYIGWLQDADGSYSGAALSVAGETTLQDYSIEADVYCYVGNLPEGSAYTGIVFYADPSIGASGIYLKMVSDFDDDQRIRLYNNFVPPTFEHIFTASDIPGGIPTEDGWHKMRVDVKTLNSDTTAFWCYFDDQELVGCPVYDTSDDRVSSGQFGLFSGQLDFTDGIPGYFDNIVVNSLISAVDNNPSSIPEGFYLEQNYPNPFNPETQISYRLVSGGLTTLGIYDLLGREIKVLVNKDQPSGSYTVKWDGTDTYGNKVPSGIYLYRLKTGDFTASKKMVLLK